MLLHTNVPLGRLPIGTAGSPRGWTRQKSDQVADAAQTETPATIARWRTNEPLQPLLSDYTL
jgi:hypothetical protein